MPADAGVTANSWIDITDFTAGIVSGYQTKGFDELAKDGAAQIRDTYGCVSMPGGGLAPGPRVLGGGGIDMSEGATLDSTAFPAQPRTIRIHAVHAQTLINVAGEWGDATHQSRQPDSVMFAVEYFYSSGADLRTRFAWWLFDQMANTWTKIADEADTVSGATGISRTNVNSPQFGSSDVTMLYSSYGVSPVPTLPGIPFAAWSAALSDNGSWRQFGGYYGDPANATQPNAFFADRGQGILGTFPVTFRMFAHNDRLCHTTAFLLGSGLPDPTRWANGDSTADDTIFFQGINNLQEINYFNLLQLSSRGIDSIGAVYSGPGNQLFIFRNREGAAVVTGSMEQPTVQQFPGVESVGNYPNKPVATPLGVVYGTKAGVFAWPGGDHSVPLSPTLQGPFWLTTTQGRDRRHPLTPCGTFAYQYPYIFVPNNWIFDVRTKGWFRLSPDSIQQSSQPDFAHYQVGYDGIVYGIPQELPRPSEGATANRPLWRIDPSRPAGQWWWRSQPLTRARNRLLKMRELTISASGRCTFDISIVGADGTDHTEHFDLSGAGYIAPTIFRRTVNVDVYDPEIKIVANETIPFGNPRIHRVSLGYHQTTSTNRG